MPITSPWVTLEPYLEACTARFSDKAAAISPDGKMPERVEFRLRCPFGDKKPTCARCPIHCYKPDMKAQIREITRYAGRRMLRRHPFLAVMHQLDSLRRSGFSRTT